MKKIYFILRHLKFIKNLEMESQQWSLLVEYDGNNIVFLEAKKSCPNVANRYESKEKD